MEKDKVFKNDNYLNYVHSVSPKTNEKRTLIRAFLVGGLICCIGQGFRYLLEYLFKLKGDELAGFVSGIMIFLGALLTGLGVYDRIGKYAGAGSIVPITGFANSVVSPAIEFKTEGFILGVGAKMFTIAGHVIVYGTVASVVYGV
ncbi:MAG: stage V sporulation protein AC, partial [Clostridia bacterium]|nr:stage V sporulation protein AC [Clostridia bacterium]